MATLGHLWHLDHAERVHHIVLAAPGEAVPANARRSEHHGAARVLLVVVNLMVLARTVTDGVGLLRHR